MYGWWACFPHLLHHWEATGTTVHYSNMNLRNLLRKKLISDISTTSYGTMALLQGRLILYPEEVWQQCLKISVTTEDGHYNIKRLEARHAQDSPM